MNNLEALKEHMKAELREDEGEKRNEAGLHIVYPGPKTKKPHCCYGHFLGQQQSPEELEAMGLDVEPANWFTAGLTFTDEVAEMLLEIDILDAVEGLHPTKRYPGFTDEEIDTLDPERFIALVSMAFQLGGPGVRMKFPSFVQAVKDKDWDRAADEMLWSDGLTKERRSQWYIDTEKRCQLMADKMRNGTPTLEEFPPTPTPTPASIEDFSDAEIVAEYHKRFDETGEPEPEPEDDIITHPDEGPETPEGSVSANDVAQELMETLPRDARFHAFCMETGEIVKVQPFVLTDAHFQIPTRQEFESALADLNPGVWVEESNDCEDIARKAVQSFHEAGIKSTGRVFSWSGKHAFCIAIVQDAGAIDALFFEPQTKQILGPDKLGKGNYRLDNVLIIIS